MIKNIGPWQVKAIGQGTAYNFSKIKPDDVVKLLKVGLDLGLRFIDTAENYGNGLAEELVGEAIDGERDKVVVATKFSPEHSDYNSVIQACEASLRRLRTDYIDLYQFHWPNPSVPLEETMRGLETLLRQGKIRAIGAGNFLKKELEKVFATVGPEKLVGLQTEYNLFERSVEQAGILDYCEKNKIAVIAWSPLAQGRYEETTEEQSEILRKISLKYHKSQSQVILRWLVAKKPVIAIPKTSNLEHLKENAESLNITLTPEEVQIIDETFFQKIQYIPIEDITLSNDKEPNSKVMYNTLEEALANKNGFVPSPEALAKAVRENNFIKPVHLIKRSDRSGKKICLIAGRLRYWAWVIAFGKTKPIPSYIFEK